MVVLNTKTGFCLIGFNSVSMYTKLNFYQIILI